MTPVPGTWWVLGKANSAEAGGLRLGTRTGSLLWPYFLEVVILGRSALWTSSLTSDADPGWEALGMHWIKKRVHRPGALCGGPFWVKREERAEKIELFAFPHRTHICGGLSISLDHPPCRLSDFLDLLSINSSPFLVPGLRMSHPANLHPSQHLPYEILIDPPRWPFLIFYLIAFE